MNMFIVFFQSIEKSKKEKVAGENDLSSCLLMVHLDSARELSVSNQKYFCVSLFFYPWNLKSNR